MTAKPLEVGDVAQPADVIGIYSTDVCEDGTTVLRLFDLRDNRTGAQSYTVGKPFDRTIHVVG